MPVAVAMPSARQQAPEKDPLDTILKGLQVAGAVFGIKDGIDKADNLKAQRELESQKVQIDANKSGMEYSKDPEGKAVLRPRNFKDVDPSTLTPEDQAKLAQANLHNFQAQGKGGEGDLAQLLKQQQAVMHGLQIQDMQRKAIEIEGPKAQAALYGRRLETANQVMGQLADAGYDRTSGIQGMFAAVAPDSMKPGNLLRQDQAERNFVNALLRRESGSAISKDEFSSAEKQYFPRVGDPPELLAQKAQNRAQAMMGLQAEAGDRAWSKVQSAPVPQIAAKPGLIPPNTAKAQGPSDEQSQAMAELIRRRGLKQGLPKGK